MGFNGDLIILMGFNIEFIEIGIQTPIDIWRLKKGEHEGFNHWMNRKTLGYKICGRSHISGARHL